MALGGGPLLTGQQQTAEMFSGAGAYQRFMGRWSEMLAPLLVDFARPPDAGRVLDVGSGTGALAFAVAARRPRCQVLGIDPSPEYVGFARQRNRFPGRASFEVGDAQRLRFADAAFTSSLSLLVFNFIPDHTKALLEVKRVTAPGGVLAAAVWDYGEGMKMLRVFWEAAGAVDEAARQADERHMPLCRAGELDDLWKRNGLEKVEARPLEITMRFASFTDYWQPFLLGQGPAGAYLRKAGEDQRTAIRREAKRLLALNTEDAPFTLPARAWALRGVV